MIIDDGSTDGTVSVIRRYAAADPRVRYVSNKRPLGVSAAWNQGVQSSRGQLIAKLDADDIMIGERLLLQVQAMESNPDLVLSGTQTAIINLDGSVLGVRNAPASDSQIRAMLPWSNPFTHSSVMYRKDTFLKIGGYNSEAVPADDLDLWLRLAAVGKLSIIDRVLTGFRLRPGSNTSRRRLRLHVQSARVRLRARRLHGLPMGPAAVALSIAQVAAVVLPRETLNSLVWRYQNLLTALIQRQGAG